VEAAAPKDSKAGSGEAAGDASSKLHYFKLYRHVFALSFLTLPGFN